MGPRIHEKKLGAKHATCLQRPPQNCYSTSDPPCRAIKDVELIQDVQLIQDIELLQDVELISDKSFLMLALLDSKLDLRI